MMTDPKTVPPDTDEQPPQPKTKRLDMSGTQLVGGALAAMTAAVIGAQLGVAGTVFGAAIGSVVAGTAGSLYTASLKHTQTKIAAAFIGRVGDTPVQITTTDRTTDERTTVDGWHAVTQPAAAVAPPSPDPVATAAEIDPAGGPAAQGPWKPILVATVAVFLLAIAGITAVEVITGQSVSGGQGTTISQVGDGRSDTPRQVPATDTTSEPTTEPSAPPSTEPSSGPGQVTEPTTAPSTHTQPSTSNEPSASSEPTATPAPSTTGGDQSAEANNDAANTPGG
ncbi:MAG TPA: hypothetical protein VIT42_03400 [Microlunatus sp.]